ncbi:MAG TPA: TonB-dependent receptor plug domain-containing protein [Arachidicoccus soli]|nr:TonB-dependent receptor plug domain-containing protein [Arachidicoccus soli]
MHNIVLYLIKVVVCSGIFFAYYLLALRNKSFHPYNRFYLLVSAGLSFLLPLLHLNMFDVRSNNEKMLAMMRLMYGGNLPDVVVGTTSPTIDWQQVLLYASLMVTTALLVLILIRIIRIYQLKKAFPRQRIEEIDFINTDIETAPFSFMKNMFWRNDIELNDVIGEQIYRHEMAHIEQKHSWDKLFFQILRAIFWMNPFYYFMQKELLLIHEFIADEKAVANRDGEAFAQMLLRTQLGKFNFEPAHPLFYSTIKKRLMMITNSQKPRYSYLRRLMVLPLLGCVTFAFAFRAHKIELKNNENTMESLINTIQQQKDTTPVATFRFTPLNEKASDQSLMHDKKLVQNDSPLRSPILKLSVDDRQPLYVIDGVPAKDKNALSLIPANAINSINVIKGKAATTIYGNRARNGIVFVTTKGENKKQNTVMFVDSKKEGNSNDSFTITADKIVVTNLPHKENTPLVFVDGMKKNFDIINSIKPTAIASINVLKDEKAIEKYGAEGKNGVIEITTKNGNQNVMMNYNIGPLPKHREIAFTSVQVRPTFPGGPEAWSKYIEHNLNSQLLALNGAPSGKYIVIVSYLISKDGSTSEIKAISAPNPDYGASGEAVRVIKASGKWNPAIQNGRQVTYRQTQRIVFNVIGDVKISNR